MHIGHFVGYGSLETLLEQAALIHPAAVFADSFSLSSTTQMGLESHRTFIQVSFLDGDVTHYWRWMIATELFTSHGEAFDLERSKRAASAIRSALDAISKHLTTTIHGFIPAVSAMPKDFLLVEGSRPSFLFYKSEDATYELAYPTGLNTLDEGVLHA